MPQPIEDDDMPDTWMKAIRVLGFPIVVACVAGWVIVVDVRGNLFESSNRHEQIISAQWSMVGEQQNLSRGVLKLADKQGETQMLQEKILGVMRAMCLQGAQTLAERKECVRE